LGTSEGRNPDHAGRFQIRGFYITHLKLADATHIVGACMGDNSEAAHRRLFGQPEDWLCRRARAHQ
jgi:hypothetical protein